MFPMCDFPVLFHLTVWTTVEFLHTLLWPQTPVPPVLQLQGRGPKFSEANPTVSFLDQVGEHVARQRCCEPLEVKFVFHAFDH